MGEIAVDAERGLRVSFLEASKNSEGDFERVVETGLDFVNCEVVRYPWTVWGEAAVGGKKRSYNCIGAGNIFYGIVQKEPESIGMIDYERDNNGKLVLRIKGENRGGETESEKMQIAVIKGSAEQALEEYKKLLPKPKCGQIENSLFYCTWASLGMGVNQRLVLAQARALHELMKHGMHRVGYFIVDDGYQEGFKVGKVFDERRFGDVKKMFSEIKDLGMKPGLWVAPFHSMDEKLYREHPELFVKDAFDPLLTRPISWHGIPIWGKARVFDISNKEAREHIIHDIWEKASMGVKIFKLDFLYGPLLHELSGKVQTPTSYWHKFFEELREVLPKEVVLMGCGVPIMDCYEFEVNRTSGDTAMPSFAGFRLGGLARKIFGKRVLRENDKLYDDALRVAGLISKLVRGAVMDGVHFDLGVPISIDVRERVNNSLRELRNKGVTNFFLGDDPRRILGRGDIVKFVNALLPSA